MHGVVVVVEVVVVVVVVASVDPPVVVSDDPPSQTSTPSRKAEIKFGLVVKPSSILTLNVPPEDIP